MTITPRKPIKAPTIRALQTDLDEQFGEGSVRIGSWNPRSIAIEAPPPVEALALNFVAGWFIGRRRVE